jgi:hypothetical protein
MILTRLLLVYVVLSSALTMETLRFSETSLHIYQTICCNVPQDSTFIVTAAGTSRLTDCHLFCSVKWGMWAFDLSRCCLCVPGTWVRRVRRLWGYRSLSTWSEPHHCALRSAGCLRVRPSCANCTRTIWVALGEEPEQVSRSVSGNSGTGDGTALLRMTVRCSDPCSR